VPFLVPFNMSQPAPQPDACPSDNVAHTPSTPPAPSVASPLFVRDGPTSLLLTSREYLNYVNCIPPSKPALPTGVPSGRRRLQVFNRVLDALTHKPLTVGEQPPDKTCLKALTLTHLMHIVGADAYAAESDALRASMDAEAVLPRQHPNINMYGHISLKSTTANVFLAALVLLSPTGGDIATTFHNKIDDAIACISKLHAYIEWLVETHQALFTELALPHPMVQPHRHYDCHKLELWSCYDTINTLKASQWSRHCYRGVTSCTIFFLNCIPDDTFRSLIVPLTQLYPRQITFLFPTSLTDYALGLTGGPTLTEGGHTFYKCNDSLVCDACLEAGIPAQCGHMRKYLLDKACPLKPLLTPSKTKSM
jgi:hypothetical protein